MVVSDGGRWIRISLTPAGVPRRAWCDDWSSRLRHIGNYSLGDERNGHFQIQGLFLAVSSQGAVETSPSQPNKTRRRPADTPEFVDSIEQPRLPLGWVVYVGLSRAQLHAPPCVVGSIPPLGQPCLPRQAARQMDMSSAIISAGPSAPRRPGKQHHLRTVVSPNTPLLSAAAEQPSSSASAQLPTAYHLRAGHLLLPRGGLLALLLEHALYTPSQQDAAAALPSTTLDTAVVLDLLGGVQWWVHARAPA